MEIKKSFSILFKILCLLGLVYQVLQVSYYYFRFITTSRVAYEIHEIEFYQTMVVCPRTMDVLDRSEENVKKYGIAAQREGFKYPLEVLSTLTTRDMFHLTPKTDKLITDCALRLDSSLSDPWYAKDNCNDLFDVHKSISGERVCFSITPKYITNYSLGHVASYLTFQNIAYMISFKGNLLEKAAMIQLMSYTYPRHEYHAPLYTRIYSKFINNFQGDLSNMGIDLYGQSVAVEKLPPPFDTWCVRQFDRLECYEDCMLRQFVRIDRIPWSSFISEPTDLKIFTYLDVRNVTKKFIAESASDHCQKQCKLKNECNTTLTITSFLYHSSSNLFVDSMIPCGPHIQLTSVPYMTLIDFIVQIGSSFGIWLGVSMLACCPIHLISKKSNHKVVKRVPSIRKRVALHKKLQHCK
jgi:hypothetical protein